jgi:Rho termination factor, N-terminal domain
MKSVKELKEEARRYGIKYWYEMKKQELIRAIEREETKLYKDLAHKPDEEGNAHSCKTHPDDICVKCLYE